MWRRLRFPIAVALTSLALLVVLGGVAVLAARPVLANAGLAAMGPWGGPGAWGGPGPWGGHPFAAGGGPGFTLPDELRGLVDIPPAERFDHFLGVQVNLKDKNNKPLTIAVTPGTVTAVSATSLTIAANDGTTKTYALNDKTVIRGKPVQGGSQATQPALANGDKAVVVTLNTSTAATAVIVAGPEGFGPHGPRGPFGPGR
jgi:hypothetical protein